MKRLILSAIFAVLAFATTASATNVTVYATNFSDFGKGMVCTVDPMWNANFEEVFHASDFNTDNTNRYSAVKIANFFEIHMHGECYRIPPSGQGAIPVPSQSSVYVVTILMTEDASKVYWKITNIDGSIEQVITVP